jgi:hypothetical protein
MKYPIHKLDGYGMSKPRGGWGWGQHFVIDRHDPKFIACCATKRKRKEKSIKM